MHCGCVPSLVKFERFRLLLTGTKLTYLFFFFFEWLAELIWIVMRILSVLQRHFFGVHGTRGMLQFGELSNKSHRGLVCVVVV